MNDDFLSSFRQKPRLGFAQALQKKLAQVPQAEPLAARRRVGARVGLLLAALALALILALAVSPAARAAVGEFIAKIAVRGLTVTVEEERPVLRGKGESYSVIWRPATPDGISADYPFYAHFPSRVPPGYRLQQQAALYYLSMYDDMPLEALIQWQAAEDEAIQLTVTKGACPNGPPEDGLHFDSDCMYAGYISVGLESEPKVVAVNDEPAVLFRGVIQFADLWDTDREWNPSRGRWNTDPAAGYSLYWEDDGRRYSLIASSRHITERQLLRMAESIP